MQKKWYVIFVHNQDEYKVCNLLRQQQIEAFIPRMKVAHRKKSNLLFVEKLMFPGYVFVESELEQKEFIIQLDAVKRMSSKSMKLLKLDKIGTSALHDEEVFYLKSILNSDKVMDYSVGIIVGSKTIITQGPLKGMENTIIKIDRHKRCALIELMICDQSIRTNVSLEIISKS